MGQAPNLWNTFEVSTEPVRESQSTGNVLETVRLVMIRVLGKSEVILTEASIGVESRVTIFQTVVSLMPLRQGSNQT